MTPSERIRRLREAKGWEQVDVARAVETSSGRFRSDSKVCKLEKGGADRAAIDVLQALAEALEVPHEAITTAVHDREISKNPIDFVTRRSLELFTAKSRVAATDAQALRETYRTLREGPREVKAWIMTFAYAVGLAQARKPGAKAPSRASNTRDRQQRRG